MQRGRLDLGGQPTPGQDGYRRGPPGPSVRRETEAKRGNGPVRGCSKGGPCRNSRQLCGPQATPFPRVLESRFTPALPGMATRMAGAAEPRAERWPGSGWADSVPAPGHLLPPPPIVPMARVVLLGVRSRLAGAAPFCWFASHISGEGRCAGGSAREVGQSGSTEAFCPHCRLQGPRLDLLPLSSPPSLLQAQKHMQAGRGH